MRTCMRCVCCSGVLASKLRVVPEAVDTDHFDPARYSAMELPKVWLRCTSGHAPSSHACMHVRAQPDACKKMLALPALNTLPALHMHAFGHALAHSLQARYRPPVCALCLCARGFGV